VVPHSKFDGNRLCFFAGSFGYFISEKVDLSHIPIDGSIWKRRCLIRL
jgi:hypothetical protein